MPNPRHAALRLLAICAALVLGAAARPAEAYPTIWVVKGSAGTVYLFGTVHALPPDLQWRSPELDRVIADSDEVWTEVPIATGDPATVASSEQAQLARKLVLERGFQMSGPPLSSRLSPDENAELQRITAGLVAPAMLDRMRPWLAAATITSANSQRLGWSPSAGADSVITAEGQRLGKRFKALETTEAQAEMLAGMPPEVELAYLRGTISQTRDAAARFEALARSWSDGDDEAVAKLANGSIEAVSQDLYRNLVLTRNRAWIPQIEGLLRSPGVKLVAVGDGHLVGKDGVAALLRARGFKVERLEQRPESKKPSR